MSELSLIAAMPACGQVPDMVFRSWTAPSRLIGTMASWRGISTASELPKSRNAASIAAMQSGMFSRGSTSSLVSKITSAHPSKNRRDDSSSLIQGKGFKRGGQARDERWAGHRRLDGARDPGGGARAGRRDQTGTI